MTTVQTYATIDAFRSATLPGGVELVYIVSYGTRTTGAHSRGGGFLQPVPTGSEDMVLTFENQHGGGFWRRLLEGGVVDAYMAGATGTGVVDANGVVDLTTGYDDSAAINLLFSVMKEYASSTTRSVELSVRIGDGTFRIDHTLDLTSFPGGAHGWVVDGTGAALLGACTDTPVIDMTDSRFGLLRNVQIIGSAPNGSPGADHVPSCGARVGRNADNDAANQMTMDHVGIRGHFKLAAMLNVGSEQFAAIGCEFANDREGDVYGYAGDGFNCLQWARPVSFSAFSRVSTNKYEFTATAHGLMSGQRFLIRGPYTGDATVFNAVLFTVDPATTTNTIIASADVDILGSFPNGVFYKKLYGGAIDTPAFTPWQQNSFKQQYHQQGNYRAPRGTAGFLETCDSQHVYQMVHPTCGYYPDTPLTKVQVTAVTIGTTTTVTIPNATTPIGNNDLVSISGVPSTMSNPLGDFINVRLFKVAAKGATSFELRDLYGQPIDSRGWGASVTGLTTAVAVRQKVAGGRNPFAGGFGMRMVVSSDAGCDVSSYLVHHEPGSFTVTDTDGTVYMGDTIWWASIDSLQGWLDPAMAATVMLSDVSFAEASAHGRGGFLLAQRDTTTGVQMVGGKVALTHAQRQFGSVSPTDKLLMSTGTGNSLWTLSNTDVVVEKVALVDVGRLAGFTGRLTAEDLVFSAGAVASYPATLAVVQALTGVPPSLVALSARLIDALLGTLDRAGVLVKLDALHVFAAPNDAAARINLANPASGPLGFTGTLAAPVFAAWRGYTGMGGQYFLSPVVPATPAHYALGDAAMAVVSRTTSGTAVSRDVSLGSTVAYIDPWSGATPQFRSKANDASENATTPTGVSSPAGFFAWSRTAAGSYAKYYGAGSTDLPATVTVSGAASGTLPSTGFEVLRGGSHQVSAAVFGGGLTQTEMNALYAALKTYLTAVGAWM